MKILVVVKTKAKVPSVNPIDKDHYSVRVRSAPEKGKANREVIELLAEYFDVPQNGVLILSGHTAKRKLIEIRE